MGAARAPAGPPEPAWPHSLSLGPLPASCLLLSTQSTEVASRGGEARTGTHSKQMPGPAAACFAGPRRAGRRAAVLERGSGLALRLQEALHEGQVVWVPPRVLGGAWRAYPRALGGLHLLS